MIRKYYFLLLLVLLSSCAALHQETSPQIESTSIILLRHAEKASDGTSDPDLNEKGMLRAARLADILQNVPITQIYSTPYKRTTQTVEVLAEQKSLDVKIYNPNQALFIEQIMEQHQGENIVIVGHSNTIPNLVNELIEEERFQQLEEKEYDKLFFVTKQAAKGKVLVLSY